MPRHDVVCLTATLMAQWFSLYVAPFIAWNTFPSMRSKSNLTYRLQRGHRRETPPFPDPLNTISFSFGQHGNVITSIESSRLNIFPTPPKLRWTYRNGNKKISCSSSFKSMYAGKHNSSGGADLLMIHTCQLKGKSS